MTNVEIAVQTVMSSDQMRVQEGVLVHMLQSIWKLTTFARGVVRSKAARKVSLFTNGLGNMKLGRLPGYGNMKAGKLRGYEQEMERG